MARRKGINLPEGDDGKTIVNMNVDGMPWYYRKQERPIPGEGSYRMTREEQRAYRWAAVKAGLAVALVFGVVFGLFIAFCDFIWFR